MQKNATEIVVFELAAVYFEWNFVFGNHDATVSRKYMRTLQMPKP